MAFLKAIQNLPKPEGFEEYTLVMMQYKKSCSKYQKLRLALEGRTDIVSEYKLMKALKEHRVMCKAYYTARQKYGAALAISKLKAKGIDVSALEFAKIADISIPLSMKDIIEQHRKDAIAASFKPGEFEAMKDAALKHMEKAQSTKEQFFSASAQDDPTLGDFGLEDIQVSTENQGA